MHTYQRSVRVDAPFDRVWDFHSTEQGLEALTPDWFGLRVEDVRGPDGEPDPAVLETGALLRSSVRPLGLGPRQEWVSEIVARDRHEGAGFFRDEMVDGPFDHWEHTHRFYADGDATVVRDRVEYRFPYGPLGSVAGLFAIIGFEPMFWFRHRRTTQLLE